MPIPMPSKLRQTGLGALCATLVFLLFPVPGVAATHGKKNPPTFVIHDFKHDVSPPLRSIRPIPPPIGPPVVHEHELLPPGINQLPPGVRPSGSTPSAGSVLQTQPTPFGPAAMPTTSQNFEGVGDGLTGFTVQSAPPDTEGDVGLNYYVQWVNSSFAVFNKSNGNVVYGPAAGNSLWSGFGGYCETTNDGDPIVQYDQLANRWVMTQFANVRNGPPFYQCIAVSQTSDPTGSWYRYGFQWPTGYLNDYPKLGVWPDGYYLTVNQFNGNTFMGSGVAVFDRSAMLTGAAATIQEWDTGNSYGGLLPSDLDGSTLPPAGEPNFQVAFGANSLLLWKLHVDWTTPTNSTFTGPTAVSGVAAFTSACNGGTCIPQPGVAQQLDSLADRLMYRLAYRNFGTYEALVVNHSVDVSGVSGVRWYEIRDPNGAPTVYQQGTYSPDTSYRWMGSIAEDKNGDMALGYSVSDGTSVYPSIRYTGRLAGDTLGTMPQGESSLQVGTGSQGPNLSRWGDYSSMSIDPADDCTFWYTNEYLTVNGTFNWHTRIGAFKYSTCVRCSAAVPTGLAVSANGDNSIQLSWTAAAGVVEYRIYRSTSASGPFQQIGTSTTNSYVDNTAQGGVTYYYEVTNYDGNCESDPSTVASGSTTGTCNLAPSFAGIGAVSNSYVSGCTLDLSWSAATSQCGGAVSYSVYRSTSSTFTPSASNRIAQGVSGTSYTDISALQYGQTYYYIVRAVDGGNGAEDSNTWTKSGSPYGPQVASVLYPVPPASAPETFESCTGLCGWSTGTFVAGGSTADWRGVQSCSPTHSGANIFRFGGNGCTSPYSSNDFAFAEPPGLAVPAGSTNVRLDFWHRWYFEPNYDGGFLALSLDGASYTAIPASAILTGPYNNTTYNGFSAWSGNYNSSMTETVVDLDAACNALTGGTGGCAGQTLYVAFTGYSDASRNYSGWSLDDVQVTADVPGSCSATPNRLPFLTATATTPAGGGQVELEWLNPATGPYGSTTIRWSTTGFPATPTSGTALVDQAGTAGLPDSTTQTGLSSANTYYYSAFVKSGTSYSTIAQVASRPPVTGSQVAWAYSSGASAMAPPGIGSVFAVSNDRAIHSMVPGSAGGAWPGSWTPHAMNGPSQARPPVLPLSIVPGATKVVFVGSQDGYVYAFNGISGQELWSSPQLGEMVQAAPAGIFTAYGGAYDLLLVGSRDAAGDNSFYGLNPADGTIAWTFNNGGGSGGIGIISGTAAVDYTNDRVYFASRARAGGSSDTLWCLSFTDTGATLLWARALGDIDGAPTLYNGRVYVGTNIGDVYAVDAATGANVWSTPFATTDGPIKGFITPHLGTGGLVFSTTNDVWEVTDNGASVSLSWSVTTVPGPSIPLLIPHSSDVYVGGSDGKLYQLDVSGASPLVKSLVLGDGTAAIGSPSYDVLHSLLYVGSDAGVVYGVSLPLP